MPFSVGLRGCRRVKRYLDSEGTTRRDASTKNSFSTQVFVVRLLILIILSLLNTNASYWLTEDWFAYALMDEELISIPLCTSSYFRSIFDYDNATLFGFAQNSLHLVDDTILSSNALCSIPFGSSDDFSGKNSMSFSHFRFGLMGSDKVALCEAGKTVCYYNLNTGILPFRKSASKRILMTSINAHIASIPRMVTYSTNTISPVAASST